jgi:hypothetical protein
VGLAASPAVAGNKPAGCQKRIDEFGGVFSEEDRRVEAGECDVFVRDAEPGALDFHQRIMGRRNHADFDAVRIRKGVDQTVGVGGQFRDGRKQPAEYADGLGGDKRALVGGRQHHKPTEFWLRPEIDGQPSDDAAHAVGDEVNAVDLLVAGKFAEEVCKPFGMPGDRGPQAFVPPDMRPPAGSAESSREPGQQETMCHEAMGQHHDIMAAVSPG